MTNEQFEMIIQFCRDNNINADDIQTYVIDLNVDGDSVDVFMNAE